MIGIIGAMKCEVEALVKLIENCESEEIAGRIFYQGIIKDKQVVVVECGVGKVNAAITTTLLIQNYNVDCVINLGVAGGLKPLKSFDLVISDKLCYHDFDVTALGYDYGVVPGEKKWFVADESLISKCENIAKESGISYVRGNVASGDLFATDPKCVSKLSESICAVEMEGAAIAHTCCHFTKPFIVLRVISDILGTEGQAVNFNLVEKEAAEYAIKFVLGIIVK